MKEIHAIQNDDGTYRVEIHENVSSERSEGHWHVKDQTEFKTTIPRATIHICALNSQRNNSCESLTFEINN